MKTIYVDNNATTRVAPEVFEEMTPYFTDLYGNPSSMHFFGGQVQRKVEEARERVAGLLGARPQEIIFTSCGTESDNAAIMSALQCNPEKRHVLTTRVEHPAVKNLVANLKREGYRVTELPVDRHGLRADAARLRGQRGPRAGEEKRHGGTHVSARGGPQHRLELAADSATGRDGGRLRHSGGLRRGLEHTPGPDPP